MNYSYRTPFGLPVRYKLESNTHIENEFLFGVYEFVFTEKYNQALGNYFGMAAAKGFPNHIHEPTIKLKPHYKKLSHDQTTAYLCYAKIIGYPLEKIPNPEDFSIRDFMFRSLLEKKLIGFLLLPLFCIRCALSFFIGYRVTYDKVDRPDQVARFGNFLIRQKLSGELLWLLRYETLHCDVLTALFAFPLKPIMQLGSKLRFGSVEGLVKAYFMNNEEHPIVKGFNYEL